MVIVSKKKPSRDCPACKWENKDFEEDQDVEWAVSKHPSRELNYLILLQ